MCRSAAHSSHVNIYDGFVNIYDGFSKPKAYRFFEPGFNGFMCFSAFFILSF